MFNLIIAMLFPLVTYPSWAAANNCATIFKKTSNLQTPSRNNVIYPADSVGKVTFDEVTFVIPRKNVQIAEVLSSAGYGVHINPRHHFWNISGVHELNDLHREGLAENAKPDFVISGNPHLYDLGIGGPPSIVYERRYFDIAAPKIKRIKSAIENKKANRFIVDMRNYKGDEIQNFLDSIKQNPPQGLLQLLLLTDQGVNTAYP